MRKYDSSGTNVNHPISERADSNDATECKTKLKNLQICTTIPCDRAGPDLKVVGPLAGSMLLFLLTCSSVSAYCMSAQILYFTIGLSFLLPAYVTYVAVRCRHCPDTLFD
jgi:hypothetical protein